MKDNEILAILYTEFDDSTPKQINLLLSTSEIASSILNLMKSNLFFFIKSKKSITTNEPFIPNSLLMLSFPSINLKGIVKHMERQDSSRYEGIAQSAIILLFGMFIKNNIISSYIDEIFMKSITKNALVIVII